MSTKTKTKTKKPAAQVIEQPTNKAVVPVDAVTIATKQVVGIIQRSIDNPKLDVRKLREIMDMQMEALRYQSEIAFNRDMVECQAVIPQIHANSENKHTKSKYANLEAIDTVVRPIISRFGFSLNFNTEQVGERHIKVICTVRHREGHKDVFTMTGELDDGGFKGTANKTGIQAAGSSSSYLQRYLIKLIFNVVIIGEDKDGNKDKATGKTEAQKFNDRVHGGATDASYEEVPMTLTKEQALKKMQDIKKRVLSQPKKHQRIDIINDDLDTLRAADAAGLGELVQELHSLADKGA